MDNQEQFPGLSRDEYIRLARESCTRNLSYGGNPKNHGGNKNKGFNNTEKFKVQAGMGHKFNVAGEGFHVSSFKIKSFLIRVICAMVLFLAIFLFDKFDVKIKTFNSQNIKEMVSSNQSIDDAESFFVNLFEQFANSAE